MDNEKITPIEETDDMVETEKAKEAEEAEAAQELEALDGAEEEAGMEPEAETEQKETDEEEPEQYNDEPPAGKALGKLTLVYEEQDILDVIKIQEKSRLSLRIMTVAMIILPIIGVASAAYNLFRNPDANVSTLILWILVVLFVFYSYCIAPKKNAKRTFAAIDQDQQAGNVSTFTVYEGGIYAESSFGKQTFLWNEFKEVHECPAGIVIVTLNRGPVFFPKRLMEGFDRDRLSEVLEENFGKKYFVCNYGEEKK